MARINNPIPPRNLPDNIPSWLRQVAAAVIALYDGRSNNVGDVTLTANSATTTLSDERISAQSVITFMPRTANAATGMTALYVSARGKQTATLTHANNAQADRTYSYVVTG